MLLQHRLEYRGCKHSSASLRPLHSPVPSTRPVGTYTQCVLLSFACSLINHMLCARSLARYLACRSPVLRRRLQLRPENSGGVRIPATEPLGNHPPTTPSSSLNVPHAFLLFVPSLSYNTNTLGFSVIIILMLVSFCCSFHLLGLHESHRAFGVARPGRRRDASN